MRIEDWAAARQRMVERQILSRGVADRRVLDALSAVERHRFVPVDVRDLAYTDQPLPIGDGQTISQPYIVALMTELLDPQPGDTLLEIGTGSGYQAAVLSSLVAQVYSIEILEPLAEEARARLEELGYRNVTVRCADGYRGWPEHAPFDGIVVTAAPPSVPQPLLEQLAVGGRMVVPVGDAFQELQVIVREDSGFTVRRSIAVRFVPMVGEAQQG
ncbi:MAG: protein-L-isoaspartate(D-aspartate) O-methyltransferase [Candidatus Eisenbacteria bacterium]|jgi:protein-L-isoaspartate(D-aspartate) O-methyltransferase|nr:protein-L-isoaspartate(D-aspartate) O-methyltransferase [Candidatus Eisenbacteria bacterium]